MPTSTPFALAGPGGVTLHGELTLPERSAPAPVVVFCHGFKGFFWWGFHPPLAARLAAAGCAAVRFNFSGAGMRPGDELVSSPEAFRADTYSRELAELLALLAALPSLAPGRLDICRLGLFGHSRGGGVALLAAARPEWRDRLRALVTWSAIGACDRWDAAQKEAWRRAGEMPVENARTGQQLALGTGLLDDLEQHVAELDLLAAAGRRRAPWLILHGGADLAVPVAEARSLARAAAPPVELVTLPGADHVFGARHPWAGSTPELDQVLAATERWFGEHLRMTT